jgi:hypothetical protein
VLLLLSLVVVVVVVVVAAAAAAGKRGGNTSKFELLWKFIYPASANSVIFVNMGNIISINMALTKSRFFN